MESIFYSHKYIKDSMKKLSQITESIWSDIQDRSSGDVVRKENQWIVDIIKEFVDRHKLKDGEYNINPDLSLDVYRNISIKSSDLVDGKLPFKFGKIDGTMWLSDFLSLTTLENSPRELTGSFVLYQNLCENFIGGPEIVGGNLSANFCRRLTSLDGSPKEVKGDYCICFCSGLKDISGISPVIGGNLEISKNCPFEDDEFRKYSNIKGQIIRK